MNLPATMNLPIGERINANGAMPCATALLERIVSTMTPRMMKTSGTQIGHEIDVRCHDPQRELDDAVAGDVEQRAEQARLVALARDVAVEPVRHEDQDDQKEVREFPRARRQIEEPDDDQKKQQQPAQRDEVRHAGIIRTASRIDMLCLRLGRGAPRLHCRAASPFIASARFTYADIVGYVYLGFAARSLGRHDPAVTRPALKRWSETIAARPAIKAAG